MHLPKAPEVVENVDLLQFDDLLVDADKNDKSEVNISDQTFALDQESLISSIMSKSKNNNDSTLLNIAV